MYCLWCGVQAGVAVSKWAIEYEQPAADAFKLNNPDAAVFCNNCNAILVVSAPSPAQLQTMLDQLHAQYS